LQELALDAGFRVVPGFHDRPIYRDLFPRGLTALDALCETMPGIDGEVSRIPACCEIEGLLEGLKLPINDRGRRHAALRAEWFASRDSPLDTDILAGP
jgi:chromosome partitioning protein